MSAQKRQWWLVIVVLGLAFAGWSSEACAEEGKGAVATGTWKWTLETPDGQTINASAKLKQEKEKLTGTYTGRDGKETAIEEGKVKGDEVSFQVNRDFNGQKIILKFNGKVSGDSLKGKIVISAGDQNFDIDWDAKREKQKKDK